MPAYGRIINFIIIRNSNEDMLLFYISKNPDLFLLFIIGNGLYSAGRGPGTGIKGCMDQTGQCK